MSQNFKYVVRISNTDLNGKDQLFYALQKIKGIGINTAIAICRLAGFHPYTKLGSLSDEDIKKIEYLVKNLHEKVPWWFNNYKKERFTGNNIHLIESDLILKAREDIEFQKALKSWKGMRHAAGLKVRGQSTRTTGRTGLTVGVTKKAQ